MVITLVHDCDIERRPVPAAVGGDFRDCHIDISAAHSNTDANFVTPGLKDAKELFEVRALLLFDLTKFIPASATITAAVWWFNVQGTDATGQLFRAVRCRRQDWVENQASWNAFKNPQDYGTADPSGNDTLIDGTKSWATNEWTGYRVHIKTGTGAGQTRAVVSNNATTLTVSPNWSTNPNATSTYTVGNVWEAAGASDTAADRDTGVVDLLGNLPTTGWKNLNLINLVSDAWDNRSGICTFIMERYDDLTHIGMAFIYTKNIGGTYPHHLRITYTLDGRTFQVMVR